MNILILPRWSPYAVGVGIGILSWIAFMLSDKPIGCSTAFARTSGIIERLFRGSKVNTKPYYQKFAPEIDWEWMLVLGLIIGAFLSAVISGTFEFQIVPPLWATLAGDSRIIRLVVAIAGGILLGFGARWAGGCTSGHGISGTLQLALSSWISVLCFFIGGLVTAHLFFRLIL